MDNHSLENCPLRSFGCITTTATAPFRIIDLDVEALDLFLTGYRYDHYRYGSNSSSRSSSSQYPHSPMMDSSCSSPIDPHFDFPEERAHARAKVHHFLTGLPMADIFLTDSQSCLDISLSSFSSSCSPSVLEGCNLKPFIISEDAMLSSTHDHHCPTVKPAAPRRVHACIHHSSRRLSGDHTNSTSASGGYRFYLIKDVTEMHGLAVAARNAIKTSVRRQKQLQQLSLARCNTQSRRTQGGTVVQSEETAKAKDVPATLSIRDSSLAAGSVTAASNPFSDPGLLILQVTRFGTVDHAFAIPQLEQENYKRSFASRPDHPLFLAHDRTAIESMGSCSLMAYVHPQDLPSLCKGLDQICKALYTVFRARWRIDAMHALYYESDDEDAMEMDSPAETIVGCLSNIIEFQGELFEEWVDPSAAVFQTAPPQDFAWTEVTGMLSNGNPLLVVRPLTALEIEELEPSSAASAMSKGLQQPHALFVDAHSDDDEGYLEMEMQLDVELDQTILTGGEVVVLDKKAQKDEIRKRMDIGEGLILSQTSMQGLSDLRSVSVAALSVAAISQTQRRRPLHNRHRPLYFNFRPIINVGPWPSLTSAAFEAWKQWVQTIHMTKEHFQAWCEYLLDAFLNQTIKTVSFGMALLGFETLPFAPSAYPYKCAESSKDQKDITIQNKGHGILQMCALQVSQQATRPAGDISKMSGLNRAGKVLEANCPKLEGVVRRIGTSWIGQQIIVTGRLDERLDVVADHVVDWWESEDRVATLTTTVPILSSTVPILNTITAYTPSFLTNRLRR
ncbi:hypothetical protein BC939DRAFT_280762 [Gamsiella multidivaricata]|uniref:uncharacterized protein n=1 Tax=Gamsiella multidivaricata TaxID=101098 RepID=UPI00221E6960|nr:uncharacterized protein BC939DRAFT_280762 [Gamsiella multidivaricata]KAG0360971.1 hypothetical protein BGZ54_009288 [Gamsiella multidivaricata]KAI7830388.1 hypothetical protein BC939DRAFT_280762 [Gamsiella multidivaricata]